MSLVRSCLHQKCQSSKYHVDLLLAQRPSICFYKVIIFDKMFTVFGGNFPFISKISSTSTLCTVKASTTGYVQDMYGIPGTGYLNTLFTSQYCQPKEVQFHTTQHNIQQSECTASWTYNNWWHKLTFAMGINY